MLFMYLRMYVWQSFRDPSLPPRLHLCAYQYKTSESDIGKIEDTNYKSLHDMVLKKKSALSSAFEAADTSNLVLCYFNLQDKLYM